MSRKAA
jgi:tRNA-splicing ligase RtcB